MPLTAFHENLNLLPVFLTVRVVFAGAAADVEASGLSGICHPARYKGIYVSIIYDPMYCK